MAARRGGEARGRYGHDLASPGSTVSARPRPAARTVLFTSCVLQELGPRPDSPDSPHGLSCLIRLLPSICMCRPTLFAAWHFVHFDTASTARTPAQSLSVSPEVLCSERNPYIRGARGGRRRGGMKL